MGQYEVKRCADTLRGRLQASLVHSAAPTCATACGQSGAGDAVGRVSVAKDVRDVTAKLPGSGVCGTLLHRNVSYGGGFQEGVLRSFAGTRCTPLLFLTREGG